LDLLREFGISRLFDALLYSSEKIRASERPRKALIVFTDGIFSARTMVAPRVQASSKKYSVH
jgi:hypothetical protein